jgi:hypothetical protein
MKHSMNGDRGSDVTLPAHFRGTFCAVRHNPALSHVAVQRRIRAFFLANAQSLICWFPGSAI